MNLVSFLPEIKLNTFGFIFLTYLGTKTRAYGLLVVLQLPPHLLAIIVNGLK